MSAGQWKVLVTQGGFGSDFLKTAGCHVGSYSILQYGNKAQWDHDSQQFFFLGSPHGNPNRFIIYSAKTNTWREGPLPSSCFNQGHVCGGCNVHSYHLCALDTVNGRFFFGTSAGASNIYVYKIASNSWSHYSDGKGRYDGMSYFADIKALIYNNQGPVYKLTDGSSTWTSMGSYSQGSTNNFCMYSPKHHAVFFGGGNGSNALYKMDISGNVTTCASGPYNLSTCHTFITHEPVTGNLLALSPENQFYEYDVLSDKWRQLPSPAPVVASNVNCGDGLVSTPVSTYGVVMMITFSPPYVLIYKHADSGSQVESTALASESGLEVFPNPFHSAVVINVKTRQCLVSTITLYNTSGRMIDQVRIDKNRAVWNAKDHAPGVYIAKVKIGNKTVSRRLLLQK
jgi:hypothetical protein